MDNQNLNQSLCKELFRGELDVTPSKEEQKEYERSKSQTQQYKRLMMRLDYDDKFVKEMETVPKNMEAFCGTKNNMFLQSRDHMEAAKKSLVMQRRQQERIISSPLSCDFFMAKKNVH